MRFFARRILHAGGLLLLISILSFVFLQAAPGNYVDVLRLEPRVSAKTLSILKSRYGLDQPLAVQYLNWVASIFRGEFGFSLAYGMPVGRLLWPRAKNTLLLTSLATALSWFAALPIGIFAAESRRSAVRNFVGNWMAALLSVPDLLVALALLMLAVRTRLFPVGGMATMLASPASIPGQVGDLAAHLALPVLALVLAGLPVLVRHVQAAVHDALRLPFIQAARAHGIPRFRLLWVYTIPAAANPLISLFGFSIGGMLSTSLLVEVIMGWPGLGPLLVEAIFSRDRHVVMGTTVLSAVFLVIGNLVADLLLYAVDPRIRQKS